MKKLKLIAWCAALLCSSSPVMPCWLCDDEDLLEKFEDKDLFTESNDLKRKQEQEPLWKAVLLGLLWANNR